MSSRLQYCVQSMESWSEFGYLTFQFSVTMAMMPCSLRVMGDSSAGVAQVSQELRSSNINQAKSTSCRLLYNEYQTISSFPKSTFHSAVELPCLPTVMTQNSCTMHRHQTYIKSLQKEQSTSILCAIDGKLIRIWISHISVLSHHGDDAL